MDPHPVVATFTISIVMRDWADYEAAMFTSNNKTVGVPQRGASQDEAVQRLMENVIGQIKARA